MAHNGGFEELTGLEAELGDYLDGVEGDTDSERYLALVTQCVDRNGGDVGAGITEAASWLADNVPLYSLNLGARDQTLDLFVLQRPRGGHAGGEALDASSDTLAVSSSQLAAREAIVVAWSRSTRALTGACRPVNSCTSARSDIESAGAPGPATPVQHRPPALHAMTHAPASESEECAT